MSEPTFEPRPPTSDTQAGSGRGGAATAGQEGSAGEIALGRILLAVRCHLIVVIAVTAFSLVAALIMFKQPALYRATAVIRLAGERRAISAVMEQAVPALDRTVGPVLSLQPLLRSRTIVGWVVDSLGFQLQPVAPFSLWQIFAASPPPALKLRDVSVDPNTTGDTLFLAFTDTETIAVRRGGKEVRSPYGRPLQLGPARFTVPAQPSVAGAVLLVRSRDVAIDQLLDRLAVVPVTGTDALEVHYLDSDPARAQQVSNLIVQTFHATNIRTSQEQARRRRQFLSGQLQETERLQARAQANLSDFRRRRQLASSAEKLSLQQSTLAALDARQGDLEENRRVYQALLAQLASGDDSTRVEGLRMLAYSPEIGNDPTVGRLYQQLLVYQSRFDSLTSGPWRSSSDNPDVVQLTELLRSAQGELVRAVRAQLKSLEERSAAIRDLRRANAQSMRALPALQAEEMRLNQQATALSGLEDQLRLEYEKSRMSEELEAGDIEIVDLASRPYRPVGVPWWVKAGLALVFGLLVSGGLAMLLEMRNKSIRAPEELERLVPGRAVGVIPWVVEAAPVEEDSASLRNRLRPGGRPDGLLAGVVADSEWPSAGQEAFRMLYSSLTYGWGQRQRSIIVTSVAPQEGKTLIATNLGVTFAREGARVLLVDCDVRRPRLHKIFGVPLRPGLMELLRFPGGQEPHEADDGIPAGRTRVEHSFSMFPEVERRGSSEPVDSRTSPAEHGNGSAEAPGGGAKAKPQTSSGNAHGQHITTTRIKGLSLLPSGALPSSPAEVLTAGAVRALLRGLAEQYDVIILDTPPVLVSADAAILAPLSDGVLLVVRAGLTDREAVEQAYHQLNAAGAYVVGAVLNDPEGEVARYRKLYYYAYDFARTPD